MTAFAAVLPRADARLPRIVISRVMAALASVQRTPCRSVLSDRCAILTAPLQSHDRDGPVCDAASGVTVAGQVLLEDPSSLACALGMPRQETDLALVARAYLHWGERCTEKLSGEFAFVLWDARARVLLSARDGLGVRRLYVAEGPHLIIVTNVLAAAVADPDSSDSLDDQALIAFLAHGAPEDGRTPFRAIRTMPAGHTLCVRDDGRRTSLARHWWFPQQRRHRRLSADAILDGYRDVLNAAVADRLRTGSASILLSGGIDSTTIAAAARHAAPGVDLRAFTAEYHRLARHDDVDYAVSAAARLGVPLMRVAGDAHEALDDLRAGRTNPVPLDEPTLSDWRALIGAAARHSTVGLYGEDGDSLFMAPGFRHLGRAASKSHLLADIGRFIAAERRLPYLGIRLRERLHLSPRRSQPAIPAFLSAAARSVLARTEAPTVFGHAAEALPPHPTRPLTQSRLCMGAAQYLAPLVSQEVTGHAIELRCPLLDSRVIQFVIDIPAIPWCQRKHLPRRAYRGTLPDAVIDRPKTGIRGLHETLVSSWQRSARGIRLEPESPLLEWIDSDRWRRALEGPDAFEVGRAWRVLQLDAWLMRRRELREPKGSYVCTA